MADENTGKSPYAKPGFIAAAVVVAILAIIAVVVIINGLREPDEPTGSADPTPEATESAAPSDSESDEGGASVCGLDEVEMSGTLDTAPEAEWKYLDTVAFPASDTAGPGNDDPAETMNCFARTPEGAVFAAAAGMAQLSSPVHNVGWIESNIVDGPVKDQMLSSAQGGGTASDGQSRTKFSGFKLLSYDGNTARVDLGVTGTGNGNSVYMSMIVPLVWEDGDWKMDFSDTDAREPAELPNLAGYAMWKE